MCDSLVPVRDSDQASSLGVGELEITPVSAAIARYLGIDLTPEGKAARNRRGIGIVVHGAPLAGKTGTAVSLAKRYGAALLTVDGVVIEAISNGSTSACEYTGTSLLRRGFALSTEPHGRKGGGGRKGQGR